MPLDHFVSQVHLRNFYAPALGQRFHGIKKADLKAFQARSEDVCRRPDGNTNESFREPRIIEDFLKIFEGRYNDAVDALRRNAFDRDAVFVVAAFISYIMTCSPTAMRIFGASMKADFELQGRLLDRHGRLPKFPDGQSFSDALGQGRIEISVDEKYPQSVAASSLAGVTNALGNYAWDILLNDAGSAFFTSDFPVVFEDTPDWRIATRLVPLAPDIAVRIFPDIKFRANREIEPDFRFPNFKLLKRRKLTPGEVKEINRSIVRAADQMVFYRDDQQWVAGFVKHHRNFRTEMVMKTVPGGPDAYYQMVSPRVRPYSFDAAE